MFSAEESSEESQDSRPYSLHVHNGVGGVSGASGASGVGERDTYGRLLRSLLSYGLSAKVGFDILRREDLVGGDSLGAHDRDIYGEIGAEGGLWARLLEQWEVMRDVKSSYKEEEVPVTYL